MDHQTELLSLIGTVRQRWFRQVALRTVGRATAAAALPVIVALFIDYAARPAGAALVWLALATFLASAALGAAVLWRMQRRPDDRHVARFIEERAAALPGGRPMDDALVSAVDGDAVEALAFRPLIIADALRRLRGIEPSHIVDREAIRAAAGQALAGTVALTLALGLGAPGLRRAIETARIRYFPQSIEVVVSPGDARVPAGTPLRIRAALHGAAGELTALAPSLTVSANGEQRTVEMARVRDGFEYALESVDRSFKYSVAAGAVHSRPYSITALFPPKVRSIELHYDFPSFTGLPPRDESDGGDVYGPAGTRVRLRVHTDKPTAGGELALHGTQAIALRNGGERVLEAEMVLRADDSYRVQLADADGLRSLSETEYFIRVMDDRPPDVRILRPSADQQITPLEEVTIEARADDDYGIAAFDLVYTVGGGPERVVRFDRVTGTAVQKIGARLLPAEELGVRPGDVITYYARARDVSRGKRSTETKSDIFFLEVKPFAEEFVAAQSQAGGGAAAAQIESLIEAQKDIISATWNIERRSQGGRSADDVKAVAQAQAELKGRTEQMAGQGGRVRLPLPQRLAPQRAEPRSRPATTDPIGAAVQAMTNAMRQLQEQKTKDAIPHEMAALNGLLQAQAEVRRRQVSQATAGGGGWGNRQGQDLSALFDKELQRQQRTNYESRSQIEERPDQRASNEDAANRIRDLARRQEDLNQRQRDLASAGLNAEERKRQLEKLTREQTELRQQAEELARDLSKPSSQSSQPRASDEGRSGQPQSSSQTQPGGGGQGTQGGEMKEASEQMRSAASELRREDPNAAARSGARAADELRRIEQQMRGGSARGAERAAGELQLESQQIAQEQHRIAAEASRLQQSQGSAAAAAARRLAAEKDRLAGRVDELQRSAQELSARKGTDGAGLRDAAQALQRERIGQRIRDSAKQMRDPGPGQTSGNPQTERQISQALDSVVDKLGGRASAETRQLSDQLNQTRDIRDRLNVLEQQIREAEARQRGTDAGRAGSTPGQPTSDGASGARAGSGSGKQAGELQRLQQEYQRELQRARQAIGQLGGGDPRSGRGMSTPEEQEFSRSAPGTESFKQDRSGWESLRKNLDLALEKYEVSVSDRLARVRAADRFSAGGSERVPDNYRPLIAKYYESLAKAKH
jgi:hypothetical protein